MPNCTIKWCQKNSKISSYKKDGITFHRYPKDPVTKEIWINSTGRDNFVPTKYGVICSRHFTEDCIESLKNNRRRLRSSSIPTLYLPSLTTPSSDLTKNQGESSSRDIISEAFRNSSPEPNDKSVKEELTPRERKMKCKVIDLICKLNKKKQQIKKYQYRARTLIKKVSSLQGMIDTLKQQKSHKTLLL